MRAKYYTYRNLNRGITFSTKFKGHVMQYYETAVIFGGMFSVSESSRLRCLAVKRRNVHAFIVSSLPPQFITPETPLQIPPMETLDEVKYNPYKHPLFHNARTGEPVLSSDRVYLTGGRAYIPRA